MIALMEVSEQRKKFSPGGFWVMKGTGLGLGAKDLKTRKERPGDGTRNSTATAAKENWWHQICSNLASPSHLPSKRQEVAALLPDLIGSCQAVQSPP